jgi:hypothetical protein
LLVSAHWEGMTSEQRESQPTTYGTFRAWAEWLDVARATEAGRNVVQALDLDPLLSHFEDGMQFDDVSWVTPEELLGATSRLDQAIERDVPLARVLVKMLPSEERNTEVVRQFRRDLSDIAQMAEWASSHQVCWMTLYIRR